jgi:hypothetical protein
MTPEQYERFLSHVDTSGECWLWTASRHRERSPGVGGYGKVKIDGRTRVAHVVMYEHHNGPVPDGLIVCHDCDTPACVRPSHLRADTQQSNIREAHAKGRKSGQRPGAAHPMARLTAEQAQAIRDDPRTQRTIAADYGISQQHVSDIKRGRKFKAVTS